jgi:hypothetical protein
MVNGSEGLRKERKTAKWVVSTTSLSGCRKDMPILRFEQPKPVERCALQSEAFVLCFSPLKHEMEFCFSGLLESYAVTEAARGQILREDGAAIRELCKV